MDPCELPALREWTDKIGTWDLRQFTVNNISVSHAVAISTVFWPKFTCVDGCLFVDFLYDEKTYNMWKTKLADDRAVERTINHLHLWDLFAPRDDAEYDALEDLARVMAKMWKMAASAEFQEYLVNVEVSNGDDDYGPTLTLHSSPRSN